MIYVARHDMTLVEPLKSIRIVSNGIDYAVMNENSVICSYKSVESAKQSIYGLIRLFEPVVVVNGYCNFEEEVDLLKQKYGDVILTSSEQNIEPLGNDVIYIFPSEEELENVGK